MNEGIIHHKAADAGPNSIELAQEDSGEDVILRLPGDSLLRIYSNLTGRMHKLGYKRLDWDVLDLGFELRPDWPVFGPAPTLAQFIVVVHKLKLRIVIDELHAEGLPLASPKQKSESGGRGMISNIED